MTTPTVADIQDGLATHQGYTEAPVYRCMDDRHPEGERPTFTSKKELKRHKKKHDPNAPRWYCGCCQNLGDKFEGNTRKDKVRDHMRNIHEKPKSEFELGIHCPEGCLTLFTVTSCLDEHLMQVHSSHSRGIPSQTTTGSRSSVHTREILSDPFPGRTCDCKQRAETKRLQDGLQWGSNKHRAGSPLQSIAKRGRHDTLAHQSSELVPRCPGFHTSQLSTVDSFASMTPTESFWLPNSGAFRNPMNGVAYSNTPSQFNFASWAESLTSRDPCYFEPAFIQGLDMFGSLPSIETLDHYVHPHHYQRSLENNKPVDFLAIRKTQGRRSCYFQQGTKLTRGQIFKIYQLFYD